MGLAEIKWINPVTFELLCFGCARLPRSMKEWEDMIIWCAENIGEQGTDWAYSGGDYMAFPPWWHFKTRDDAVLFKLTWF